jgi:hypothetical protein
MPHEEAVADLCKSRRRGLANAPPFRSAGRPAAQARARAKGLPQVH